MKNKTFLLQTEEGETVYSTGRFEFSLTKGIQKLPSGYNGDFSIPVQRMAHMSTPKERATFLQKLETHIGKKLIWVKGPEVESIEL